MLNGSLYSFNYLAAKRLAVALAVGGAAVAVWRCPFGGVRGGKLTARYLVTVNPYLTGGVRPRGFNVGGTRKLGYNRYVAPRAVTTGLVAFYANYRDSKPLTLGIGKFKATD